MIRKSLYVGIDGLPTESSGMFEAADYVSASTGVSNAGAPMKLDANGKIDPSFYNNNIPAVDSTISNSLGYFTSTNVDAALNELYTDIINNGVKFTVGTGGVNKGDLLYISSNNTVNTYSTLTTSQRIVGVAETTVAAAGGVVGALNGVVLKGILTGATAGVQMYWNGTALTATLPTTTLSYVYEAGTAINATDLYVDVRIVRRTT